MNKLPVWAAVLVLSASCGTVDVQKMKIQEIRARNKELGDDVPVVYVTEEEANDRERKRREADLNIIEVKNDIFVPVDSTTQRTLTKDQVVQSAMQEAMVTPKNFIGGTQFYDYNEHKQYPIVCKVLGLSVLQLEDGEVPIGVPYLSDTLRWEITGDVWRTQDGRNIQLVMIKPLEPGLSTNMVLVTTRRIYQIMLTSTRDSYMPMVRFRYPMQFNSIQPQFNTARTIEDERLRKEREDEGYYLSYNYKIISGWWLSGWFRPEWTPTEVWDDGHKTYIQLPRGVLQMEYPTVFEGSTYIVNYRVNENVMILDKLVKKATLRLNGKRVSIVKMKGEAEDLRRYVKREVEIIGERPPVHNGTQFMIQGDVPWLPEKVIEYDGEIYIFFADNVFNGESVLYVIDEKKNRIEYRRNGNIIIIPRVAQKLQLAYNNQLLTINRK
ncbi:MAG: TrbG/VirB9 family P-type conjugative transfer protein [Treponema sp.]|jgi:type IV secretion system protein VirB9|nr:TrbG/VirB9 family P-type conjugative transfer protein [Treponema sp.]